MANGIRTGDPCGFSKGRSSKFREGSQVRQTPEEDQRKYRPPFSQELSELKLKYNKEPLIFGKKRVKYLNSNKRYVFEKLLRTMQ